MTTRKQILATLKECGVLSGAALFSFVGRCGKRAFLYSLARLVANGLVVKRLQGASGGKSVYYQLSQDPNARCEVARILCCAADELNQSVFRGRDLPHVEGCAIATAHLKRLFPSARVLREFEIVVDPTARDLLLWRRDETDLLPDVLLILKDEHGECVSVAFEIERCRKSDDRIVKKLSNYASQTKIDGVVYFCEPDHLPGTISSLYRSRALQKAVRIRHYADEFLLLGAIQSARKGPVTLLLNAGGKEARLSEWVHSLEQRKTKNLSLKRKVFPEAQNQEKQEKCREKMGFTATCCPLSPSVPTPHLHLTDVALHAPVGSGNGRLVQQVAGEKLKLKTGDGIGNGNGSGDGNSNGRKLNLGSKTIQGSKLIQGQIQKKTEQQNKEGPHGSGNHFDV